MSFTVFNNAPINKYVFGNEYIFTLSFMRWNSIISTFMWSVPFSESCKFSKTPVPNLFDIRDWFHGRHFLHRWLWDDLSTYNSCVFYFYYYYISCTSDHQSLNPRGWGPCFRKFLEFMVHPRRWGGAWNSVSSNQPTLLTWLILKAT